MTTASDNVFPKLILEEGSAPATPASGTVIQYAKTDGLIYSKDDAGTETLVSGGAGGGSGATAQMNQLGSDVSISSAQTWTDGPSLSLAAGTYVLMATLTVVQSASTGRISMRLSDGTTHLASTEMFQSTASRETSLTCVGYVVVGSTTTWKAQAATGAGVTGTIKAANPINAAGNVASTLVALKIA